MSLLPVVEAGKCGVKSLSVRKNFVASPIYNSEPTVSSRNTTVRVSECTVPSRNGTVRVSECTVPSRNTPVRVSECTVSSRNGNFRVFLCPSNEKAGKQRALHSVFRVVDDGGRAVHRGFLRKVSERRRRHARFSFVFRKKRRRHAGFSPIFRERGLRHAAVVYVFSGFNKSNIALGCSGGPGRVVLGPFGFYFTRLAMVASMVARLAAEVPMPSHCVRLVRLASGLVGTTISHPGCILALWPTRATVPFM